MIAQSRKDKKEEGLKAFLLSQRTSWQSLKHKGFVAKGCSVSSLLILFEVLSFIGIMTTSTSESSKSSFITRFFDEDMKQDLFIMMDMVREMYEDGRKSIILREQLNSMKEEKQLLSDKLQEMERQLHIAN